MRKLIQYESTKVGPCFGRDWIFVYQWLTEVRHRRILVGVNFQDYDVEKQSNSGIPGIFGEVIIYKIKEDFRGSMTSFSHALVQETNDFEQISK